MTFNPPSIVNHTLSKKTSFFGIKLSAAIISCIVFILLLILIFTLAFIYWRFKKTNIKNSPKHEASRKYTGHCSIDRRLLSHKCDIEMCIKTTGKRATRSDYSPSNGQNNEASVEILGRFMLDEIEAITNGLAHWNVIGRGDYGEAFHGFLMDNTRVVVKNLFTNSSMETFVREAETMMLIRHKNLVNMLGYCAENTYRMLVCEYVENDNLENWLHKDTNKVSNLTWDIRMKIILGIAKGLAYLHEGIEPSIVHRNIKSSNIQLDKQWNPKISEVGIIKFSSPESNCYPPTGMSGYLAPEYNSNRAVDEIKSDVYSFGVLIMEIISGKMAILESTASEIEEHLVDWIELMVAEEKFDLIIDPKLHELPCRKELERILLIALRCVDFEAKKGLKLEKLCICSSDLLLSEARMLNPFEHRFN